jgi:cell division protein ZapA
MAATVPIMIVGRTYEISCDEGQEETVRTLGAEVDRRAAELLRSVGQAGDSRLIVMVALLLVDELAELRRQVDSGASDGPADLAIASSIETLARRVDAIADRLEKA